MGIDVFQIGHGLLERISGLFRGPHRGGMGLDFGRTGALLLLKILQHATGEGAEGLQGRPAQLLLLTQGGALTNQAIVLAIKTLTVRALTGLFRHVTPSSSIPIMTSD